MATRITGLSNSGLDTDALVKSLMKAQRIKYDKMGQQKTQLEWKKADYNTLNTALTSFRNNTVFNFKLSSSLNSTKTESTDSTKVTATANASATTFTHVLNVTTLATGASMTSSGVAAWTAPAADTVVNINGKDITVNTTDTAYDFVSKINNTAGLNVKANYDATLNKFFMYSTDSGSAAKIDLTANAGAAQTLLTGLGLNTGAAVTGVDSAFTLDGVSSASLGITSNTFTVSGVKYSLKATGTASVAVSSDTDKVIANVKSFIESYNTMLGTINTELSETRYKDFMPLTSDQKAEMKDDDITAWETKAKSGLFRNDPILSELSYSMRDNLSSQIAGLTGTYTTASSIGITTGGYLEKGKLYLDEDKLRKALEADPQIVQKMFGTDGGTTSANGIAVRLYDTLKIALDKIKVESGTTASATSDYTSSLGKKINDYETRMSVMETRLTALEESYYSKFSKMETALTKLNSQSSWLTQQLGG